MSGQKVTLRRSATKGEGVFAAQAFEPGDVVMVGTIEKVLTENHAHASQIGENEYVLPAGLLSKVNHSCEPNCGISVNETGAHDYIALRAIEVDEEITFDYAMQNYVIEHFPEICMCGSKNCRGRITGWKDLPPEKKEEYAGVAAPYLFDLDTKHSRDSAR